MSDDSTLEALKTLPFSLPRQEALLGYLILDEKFFTQASVRLKPEWFLNLRCAQTYDLLRSEASTLRRHPRKQELIESRTLLLAAPEEAAGIRNQIEKCCASTALYGLDSLTPELTDWLHARIFTEKVRLSTEVFNRIKNSRTSGDGSKLLRDAFEILREMTRDVDDVTFEPGTRVAFGNYAEDFASAITEVQNGLTFGVPAMDRLLQPPLTPGQDSVNGCLLRGDTTILLAPSNVGKTSAMITVACHNIKAGKNVLFIPHEGRPADLKLKFWCCMTGKTRGELLTLFSDPSKKQAFDFVAALLDKRLLFVPMNKAGLCIEEVAGTIQRHLDKFKADHGEPIDLIVDDYLATLNTTQNARGNLQKRQQDDVIYRYGVQIALEHNVHMLTAIQTNREGSKTNNKHSGVDRLLGLEDVSESWGPITSATNVISINRDHIAQARNRITFHICKSRSSEVGWAVVCRSNFPCCITHAPEYGATWYRGNSTMADRIDQLMAKNLNSEIPVQDIISED